MSFDNFEYENLINNKKKLNSKNPINYGKSVLLIIKALIATMIIIIIGVSFIFTTNKETAYMNIKYPTDRNMYFYKTETDGKHCGHSLTGFPYVDAGRAGRGIIGNMIYDSPDLWGVIPNYSKWISLVFLDTYMVNRALLKSIVHYFHSDTQACMPDSLLFITGCLQFILLTTIFIPASFLMNYFWLSWKSYFFAFVMGGFIPAIPMAAYNSVFLYCSYAYNSTVGPILENSKEFIASGKNVQWMFILIFFGFFAFNSRTCVSPDISLNILIMYLLLAFVTIAYQTKRWFISNKT